MRRLRFLLVVVAAGCASTEEPAPSTTVTALDVPAVVHGRGLVATVNMPHAPRTAYAVVDSGSASAQLVTNAEVCGQPVVPFDFEWCGADSSWTLDWPRGLANGHHTLRVVVTDSGGIQSAAQANFVTDLPQIMYAVTPLNAGGATDGDALDINSHGAAVGWVTIAGTKRAAMWSPETLTLLDDAASSALALNDSGLVVGTSAGNAVVWSSGTRTVAATGGSATAVNNAGVAVLFTDERTPALWKAGLTTFPVNVCDGPGTGIPARTLSCYFTKINDAGKVIGIRGLTHNDEWNLMGYDFSAPFPIPPGFGAPAHFSTADALNNSNQYAGSSTVPLGTLWSEFLFLGDHSLEAEFGMVSPDNQIGVRDLNDNGDLLTFEAVSHEAFILRGGRVLQVTPNDPGVVLDDVHAINNAGSIVGRASGGALGLQHAAVLLKPISS